MPDDKPALAAGLLELADLARAVAEGQAHQIAAYASKALDTVRAEGTLLFCGNGGSAADAQHLAAEYVGRFAHDRRALPAMALTVNTSILTACANDLGYEEVFARQVEALGRVGDLLVLHSTSGGSMNVLRAAETAAAIGITTVGLAAGDGGALIGQVDIPILVPTRHVPRAQEIHLAIGHIVCQHVENSLFGVGVEGVAGEVGSIKTC